MFKSSIHSQLFWLSIALLGCVTTLWFLEPIAQDPNYHHFADSSALFGVPNFANVCSNFGFLLAGLYGLLRSCQVSFDDSSLIENLAIRQRELIFFGGICLVTFGSGYYHLAPDNASLLWDRLPMTIGFMALFAMILGEAISQRIARVSLYPLLVIGIASVLYWYYGERAGQGDLRFYALVQFFPLIAIGLLLCLPSATPFESKGYWLLILFYVLAKLLEWLDETIYHFVNFVSGHSLKHIAAAIGVFLFARERFPKQT